MGKAQILSGGTDGLYNVRILKETAKAALRKTALETRLTALLAIITTKELEFYAALAEFEAKRALLTNAISAYNAGSITIEALKAAQAAMLTAYNAHLEKQKAYNRLVLEETSLRKQLSMIEPLFENEDRVGVWCADLTETLTGEVGSIEVNGEDSEIIIMPEGDPGLGQIQEAAAGTPAGTFYNWAVRPGWQKFKPTYRTGAITWLSGDLCNVTLDAAASSDQNLNINQDETLINVPIEYMTCNGSAFEVGDEVVVEFEGQNWDSPKVIGFRANPKGCDISLWVISTIKATGVNTPLIHPGYWQWNPVTEEYEFHAGGGTIQTLYGADGTVRLARFNSATYESYLNREYTLVSQIVTPGYLIWDPATNRPVSIVIECSAVICDGPNDGIIDIKYLEQSHYFNGVWYHIYFHMYPMLHYVGSVPIFDGYAERYLCNEIDLTASFGITNAPMTVITQDEKLLFVCPETSEWLAGYIYDTAWNVVGLVTTVGVYPSGYSYYAVSGNIYNAALELVGKTVEVVPLPSRYVYGSYVSGLGAVWRLLTSGGKALGWRLDFTNSYLGWWPITYIGGGGLMDISTVHFAGATGLSEAYDSTIQG
jgi:hypothetical protein